MDLSATESWPPISVIVPVYNGAGRLPKLLASLRSQLYNQSVLEVIVVDDHSTDASVSIAQSFGARIVENGTKNPERGKSIGIESASHELLLFLDDDNYLPHPGWLTKLVRAFEDNPKAVGAQCAWFTYQRHDVAINRWCCLFGMIDPLVYYLGRQDHLRYIDHTWSLSGTVVSEDDNHWLIRFSPRAVPTLGSQGFLVHKSTLDCVNWRPFFFHVDANFELVKLGRTDFVILKDSVGHVFGSSLAQILGKIRRNIRQFARDSQIRTYRYDMNLPRTAWAFIKMLTICGPAIAAIRTYRETKDPASWLNPCVSLFVALQYLALTPLQFAKNRLSKLGTRG